MQVSVLLLLLLLCVKATDVQGMLLAAPFGLAAAL